MNDSFKNSVKGFGFFVSILLMVIGALCIIRPIATLIGIQYLACIGLLAYGVCEIYTYFKDAVKSGWKLAMGIINILMAIWIIFIFFIKSPEVGTVVMVWLFAFTFSVLAFSSGINKIVTASALKKAGVESTGMLTISGVLSIILGVFLIFSPFTTTIALEWVFGIYILTAGIALFIESLSF